MSSEIDVGYSIRMNGPWHAMYYKPMLAEHLDVYLTFCGIRFIGGLAETAHNGKVECRRCRHTIDYRMWRG